MKVCRGCLASTGKLERITELTKRVFYTICGLTISEKDEYPQYLCKECSHQLRKALAFRRKTRRAHFVMKQIKISKKEITEKDLKTVDRKMSNLISSLSNCKPNNCAVYSLSIPEEQPDNTENMDTQEVAAIDEAEQTPINILNFSLNKGPTDVNAAHEVDLSTTPEGVPHIKISFKDDPMCQTENPAPTEQLLKNTAEFQNSAMIVVDIKPANYKEIERLEEERLEEEKRRQVEDLTDMMEDDNNNDDMEDAFDPATIDLNDVFKGLKEKETEESDDGLSEMKYEFRPKWPKKRKNKNYELPVTENNIENLFSEDIDRIIKQRMLLYYLGEAKIRLLSPQEQEEGFAKRKQQEPYKSALYRCSMCLKKFPDRHSVLVHLDTRHVHKEERCKTCLGRFKDKEQLEIHQAWEHLYEYTCSCNKIWYSLQDLVSCCTSHQVPEEVTMEGGLLKAVPSATLNKKFKKKLLAPEDWASTVAATKLVYSCTDCGADYHSKKVLDLHRMSHCTGPSDSNPESPTWTCAVCICTFFSGEAMTRHFLNNHSVMYTCVKCCKTMDRTKALTHCCRKSNRSPFVSCINCRQVFTTRSQLIKHQLETYHMIVPNEPHMRDQFTCADCNETFTSDQGYVEHRLLAHGDADPVRLECESCKKVFFDITERDNHVASCTRFYPVKCLYCDEMLENKRKISIHTRLQHRDEMYLDDMVVCEACGVIMAKSSLYQHKPKCDALICDKGPRCPICLKTYVQAQSLVVHMLRSHISRPYCCTLCDMRFVERSDVKNHILKIHAPEKLYECNLCPNQFSCLEYLSLHQKKVHKLTAKKTDKIIRHFTRKALIVYPHMKIVGGHIPLHVIEDCKVMLSDYLNKNLTPVPRENVKDYFNFDVEVDIKMGSKKSKRIKEAAPHTHISYSEVGNDCKEEKSEHEIQEVEIENVYEDVIENVNENAIEISYVKDKDGEFNMKENAIEISYVKDKDGEFNMKTESPTPSIEQNSDIGAAECEEDSKFSNKTEENSDNIAFNAFGQDIKLLDDKCNDYAMETDPDASGTSAISKPDEEFDNTNPNFADYDNTHAGFETDTNLPMRLEIDAQELAKKYEVIEIDGAPYVNLDGVIYRIEYS